MSLNESKIQLFGLAIIIFVVLTGGFNFFFGLMVKDAKKSDNQPIMELEFVSRLREVKAIAGDNPKAAAGLKTFLIFDAFAFIPLYLFFLLTMSFFLSQSDWEWAKTTAKIAVLLAVAAAAADFVENYFSYLALESVDIGNPEQSVAEILWAARIKWLTIFAATGILSLFFRRGGYWNGAVVLLILASLGGLSCLFIYHKGITAALGIQLLILLFIGFAFVLSERVRADFLRNS